MTMGMYKGRPEENPGKMMFRHKGTFAKEIDARKAQDRLRYEGKKTKVVKYTDGWSLYVFAPHDFWKRSFILKR